MKLFHIQVMVAVADGGSVRSDAQVSGKTQPAPKKQFRQVEVETGLALFLETSRAVQADLNHLDVGVAARNLAWCVSARRPWRPRKSSREPLPGFGASFRMSTSRFPAT